MLLDLRNPELIKKVAVVIATVSAVENKNTNGVCRKVICKTNAMIANILVRIITRAYIILIDFNDSVCVLYFTR